MRIPVLLPKIFNYPLTYISSSRDDFQKGDIVEVPFGNKKEIGVVWSKRTTNLVIGFICLRNTVKENIIC